MAVPRAVQFGRLVGSEESEGMQPGKGESTG